MARKTGASGPRTKRARKSKAAPRRLDHEVAQALALSLSKSKKRRKKEELVRHLFKTFEKIKARRIVGAAETEVFSSQDPARTNPPTKTSAQMAFDRISPNDRTALLEAFAQQGHRVEPT